MWLNATQAWDKGLHAIAEHGSALRHLDIGGRELTGEGLAALTRLTGLTGLSISNSDKALAGSIGGLLGALPELEQLDLSCTVFTDKDITAWGQAAPRPL